METLSFQQLPVVVKVPVGGCFLQRLWSIEEFIIDRHGL
jgi:hypothetical protein